MTLVISVSESFIDVLPLDGSPKSVVHVSVGVTGSRAPSVPGSVLYYLPHLFLLLLLVRRCLRSSRGIWSPATWRSWSPTSTRSPRGFWNRLVGATWRRSACRRGPTSWSSRGRAYFWPCVTCSGTRRRSARGSWCSWTTSPWPSGPPRAGPDRPTFGVLFGSWLRWASPRGVGST